MIKTFVLVVLVLFSMFSAAHSLTLEPRLSDPSQEARAQALFKQIRCTVCQGETIYDSKASLARDLREQTRKLVNTGKSDQAILDYMAKTYGAGVLLKPRFDQTSWILWLAPIVFLAIGALLLAQMFAVKKA